MAFFLFIFSLFFFFCGFKWECGMGEEEDCVVVWPFFLFF